MAEGLQRARWRHACSCVLTAALAAAVFFVMTCLVLESVPSAAAQARAAVPTGSAAASVAAARARAPQRRSSAAEPALGTLAEKMNANTISIVSGTIDTTDLTIASDLSAVLDDGDAFRILPIAGKGGGQNIRDVRLLKGVDLGITQSTMLALYQGTNGIGRIDDKISYLTKLFNEEMHILVRADSPVASVAELDGTRVNYGDVGSGTQLTARDVFARLGVAPAEVNMRQADAVEKLRSGEIAATVLVSAKPVPAMVRLGGAEFRLLPLSFAKPLQADYLPATLTADDYPGLIAPGAAVETVAVGAVLFAHNWPKGSQRYRRIEQFVERFFPRLAELQKPPRHPKWTETSLSASVPGWTRFPAAEEWLRRHAPSPAQVSREQFERFLANRRVASDDAATPSDRERLFHEFLRWNETRERR